MVVYLLLYNGELRKFYPQKKMCGNTPDGVQLISLYNYYVTRTKTELSKTLARRLLSLIPKTFVRMGGWVDGVQKGPSIFFNSNMPIMLRCYEVTKCRKKSFLPTFV